MSSKSVAAPSVVGKVLVVPESSVRGLYVEESVVLDPTHLASIATMVKKDGRFVDREWAERHSSVKQIISFAVLQQGPRVVCLRRSIRGNRQELRLRYTILFGGHVDEHDMDAEDSLTHCLRRELDEELKLTLSRPPVLVAVVADPTTEVGRLHLGFIFSADLSGQGFIPPRVRDPEFVQGDGERKFELSGADELKALPGGLDPWSSMIAESGVLDALLQERIAGSLPSRQLKLSL